MQYIELLKFNLESRKKRKNIAVNVIAKKITEKKMGYEFGVIHDNPRQSSNDVNVILKSLSSRKNLKHNNYLVTPQVLLDVTEQTRIYN